MPLSFNTTANNFGQSKYNAKEVVDNVPESRFMPFSSTVDATGSNHPRPENE